MSVIETYLDKAIEANSGYSNLTIEMNTNANDYITELTRENLFGIQNFSLEDAMDFAGIEVVDGEYQFVEGTGYTIVDSYTDSDTGYSGTLLYNNATEEYTFTNRGTEFPYPSDIGDDGALLAGQIPEQFDSMAKFIQKHIDSGEITQDDTVTMSGHSLGGALAQMGTAAFSDYIDQAYTYNSPGAKDLNINVMYYEGEYLKNYEVLAGGVVTGERISKDVYDAYQRYELNNSSEELHDKITNIKAQSPNNVISNLGEDIGKEITVEGSTHFIGELIDTLKELPINLLDNLDENSDYNIVSTATLDILATLFKTTIENILSVNPNKTLVEGFLIFDFFEKLFLPDDAYLVTPTSSNPFSYNPQDAEMPRRDPLVLDMDKDGFISTVALEDSNAYFDLTGDGIKEKVGWIEANDGLLTYDKNDNGKIDGIDEVFGNQTTSGFDELRELIDSNGDNKIDRRDELFNRLHVWHDKNGDGITQEGELLSLKEEGITSIDLNAITTNIEVDGNLITEASKYTDSQGNQELVVDLELQYDVALTTIDTSTIPDFAVDITTLTLPNLRGYGLVMDSFVMANSSTCRNILVVNNILHVDIKEVI